MCDALHTSVAYRVVVKCPLVDKLYNGNTHEMVEGCFVRVSLFIFFNIHLSAIMIADMNSLENA